MVTQSKLGWADAVVVAGAEAVEAAGGPRIRLRLGRKTVNREDPRGVIPGSGSSIFELREQFDPRGFTDRDIVALFGAHSLGVVRGEGPFCALPNKFKNE